MEFRRIAFAFASWLAISAGARAQESGDAGKGLAYAQRICAECHAVLPSQNASPNAAAPTFYAIANTSGMSGTALAVWFRTPHPNMPNLIIQGEESDNVIAYILGLKLKK